MNTRHNNSNTENHKYQDDLDCFGLKIIKTTANHNETILGSFTGGQNILASTYVPQAPEFIDTQNQNVLTYLTAAQEELPQGYFFANTGFQVPPTYLPHVEWDNACRTIGTFNGIEIINTETYIERENKFVFADTGIPLTQLQRTQVSRDVTRNVLMVDNQQIVTINQYNSFKSNLVYADDGIPLTENEVKQVEEKKGGRTPTRWLGERKVSTYEEYYNWYRQATKLVLANGDGTLLSAEQMKQAMEESKEKNIITLNGERVIRLQSYNRRKRYGSKRGVSQKGSQAQTLSEAEVVQPQRSVELIPQANASSEPISWPIESPLDFDFNNETYQELVRQFNLPGNLVPTDHEESSGLKRKFSGSENNFFKPTSPIAAEYCEGLDLVESEENAPNKQLK